MITGRKRFTREELYDLVWSEPMTKAAQRFGMSDVGLKKICVKNSVPVPARGYWRRLEVGKGTRRPPLSKRPSPGVIVINVYGSSDETQETLASDTVREQIAVEEQQQIIVPD